MARNDDAAAAALFTKAVEQNPKSADAHYWLANAYGSQAQKAGLFGAASLASKTHAEFEKAVELDPNHVQARFGLVEFFAMAPGFMGGSFDKAFEQAAEIKKRDSLMGHRAFAVIYSHQKKPELARKEYVEAVREQPNSAKAHIALGTIIAVEKNYSGAASEFETAVKLEPAYMPGWFYLGRAAAEGGTNAARGEEALHKYLAYTPKSDEPSLARAHFWLGALEERAGRKAEAKASYATSLKLNPNQKDVAEALKRVS
jgi:tetratricopeptide (TPR) repeat protein